MTNSEPFADWPVPHHMAAALTRTHLLTPQEKLVHFLLGQGHDNRSLARELSVSERTVKRHVSAILDKLGLESRLQAGLAALLSVASETDPRYGGWPKGLIDLARHAGNTVSSGCRRSPPAVEDADGDVRPARTVGRDSVAFDALAALRAAGNLVDLLTAEQQAVFAQLTEEEVKVLNSVKARLDVVSDAEVEGHGGIKIV